MQKMLLEIAIDRNGNGQMKVVFSPEIPSLLPHEYSKYSLQQQMCNELLDLIKTKMEGYLDI